MSTTPDDTKGRPGFPMFKFLVEDFRGSDGLIDADRVVRRALSPFCERGYEKIYRRECLEFGMKILCRDEWPSKDDTRALARWHERMMLLWINLASSEGSGWGTACYHAQAVTDLYTAIGDTKKAAEMEDWHSICLRRFEQQNRG